MSDQAANEGEIDQGGDHLREAALNGAIRKDFNKSFSELIV